MKKVNIENSIISTLGRYFSVVHDILCVNSNLKLPIIFGLLLF